MCWVGGGGGGGGGLREDDRVRAVWTVPDSEKDTLRTVRNQ